MQFHFLFSNFHLHKYILRFRSSSSSHIGFYLSSWISSIAIDQVTIISSLRIYSISFTSDWSSCARRCKLSSDSLIISSNFLCGTTAIITSRITFSSFFLLHQLWDHPLRLYNNSLLKLLLYDQCNILFINKYRH